jgi:hypothetical protein
VPTGACAADRPQETLYMKVFLRIKIMNFFIEKCTYSIYWIFPLHRTSKNSDRNGSTQYRNIRVFIMTFIRPAFCQLSASAGPVPGLELCIDVDVTERPQEILYFELSEFINKTPLY